MTAAVAAPPGRATVRDTPFKGLNPYGEDDAELFFGRDVWCEIVTDNLKAYRLTLFYGESGVGKSSLLQAGVAHRLRAQAPVIVFSTWRGDVEQELVAELDGMWGDGTGNGHAQPTGATLEAAVERCALRSGSRVYLILDQFEEYFVYHPDGSVDDAFATALPRVLARRDVPVSVLIAIREDAVARLDRFKAGVPNLFDNSLRLDHLDRAAAREAIERPLERWRATRPDAEPSAIEPELVDAVLQEVKAGTLEVAQGSSGRAASHEEVETPYLQLVLTRLWAEEAAVGSNVMRLSTLQRLGGAQGIVSTHLESAMESLTPESRDIAAAVFRYLVTRSRSKIAHSVTDLAEWTDVDQARLLAVMERLSRGDARILRPVGEGSYEIYHDVLADAIVAWRAGHEATRRSEEVLRRSIRRLLVVAGVLAFAVVVVLAILALKARDHARDESARARSESVRANQQQAIASSREFATRAITLGRNDYDLGLGVAVAAWDKAPTDEARLALSQILRWRAIRPPKPLDTGRGLVEQLSFNHDGTRILTVGSRSAILWTADRQRIATLAVSGDFRSPIAAFSANGRRVVSSATHTAPVVWDVRDGTRVAALPRASIGSRDVAIDAEGRLVATLQHGGLVTVWNVADRRALGRRRLGIVSSIAFADHGSRIFATRRDGGVSLWRPRGAPPTSVLSGLPDGYWTVSPDGERAFGLRTRNPSRLVVITAGSTRRETIREFPKGTSGSFTADGRRAFVSRRASVSLLDGRSGRELRSLRLPSRIDAISSSRGGDRAVLTLRDGSVRLWETTSGHSYQLRRASGRSDHFFSSVALDSEGRRLLTAEYPGGQAVWAIGEEPFAQLAAGPGWLSAAAVDPREDLIAIGTQAGSVRLAKLSSGETLLRSRAGEGRVVAVRFSRDGSRVLAAHAGGQVVVWDVARRAGVATLTATGGRLTDARFNADGSQIVTADARGAATIWRLSDQRPVRVLHAGRRRLLGAAFSPDGTSVVTAEGRARATLWDARSGRRTATFQRDQRYRLPAYTFVSNPGVEFSPDGSRVLLVGADGGLRLWDMHGQLLTERRDGPRKLVNQAVFSPDGKLIAAGTDNNAVLVLDGHTGELIRRLRAPDSEVAAVAFNPDSTQIAGTSGGTAAVTRVWDANTGKHLMLVRGAATYGFWWVGFAPDGQRIATLDGERRIRVRVCPGCLAAAELIALAKRSAERELTHAERRKYLHER